MSLPERRKPNRPTTPSWLRRLPIVVVVAAVMIQAFAIADSAFSADSGQSAYSISDATSAAAKKCSVKKQLSNGKVVTVYKTKLVKVKVKGKTVKKRVYIYKTVKKNGKKVKVKVPKTAACTKTKLCVVKKKNKAGKNVTVYLTRLVAVKKNGKVVKKKGKVVKKRVFVYKKVKGKKVKVPKLGACKKTSTTTTKGIPVTITIKPADSHADLDFGAFQRELPLEGVVKGFIVGKGFQLGQDNQIQLTSGRIGFAPTGIFIDDDCDGQVSDSIRTDPNSFTEIDPTSTSNNVNVAANSTVTGLLHMRVQVALQMRNDDSGCTAPYFTTGWTDFSVPLFVKGKIGLANGGLASTLTIGETVLDNLSACLAPGDPNLPCDGFAIPFPGILTAKIVGMVKIG